MKSQDLMKLLNRRVSTRQFTGEVIPIDQLEQLLEAGRTAPTARNRQLLSFTAVNDEALVKELSQAMGQALGRADYDLYHAKQVILISTPASNASGAVEVGLATAYIYLMAEVLGLGMVWTNQLKDVYQDPAVQKVLNKIGIPADHQLFNALPIGYPAQKKEPTDHQAVIRIVSSD